METDTVISLVLGIIALIGLAIVGGYVYLDSQQDIDIGAYKAIISDGAKDISKLQSSMNYVENDISNLFDDMKNVDDTDFAEDIDDNHDEIRNVIKCLREFDDENTDDFIECIEDQF